MGGMLLLGVMFLGLLLGVPIALSVGVSCAIYILFYQTVPLTFLAEGVISGANSFVLLAIPFFVLGGELMGAGGISQRLIDFCMSLLKGRKGALGIVTVVACMFFAALSGSGAATVACIGGIMIPQMVKNGYEKGFATALTCAAGALGPIIPPSVLFLIYGVSVQVSVADLFMGGVIPGVIITIVLSVLARRTVIKENFQPPPEVMKENQALQDVTIWQSFKKAIWALMVPIIILGGIYGGIFTPTEAAVVSCAYALFVAMFIYRELKPRDLPAVFIKATRSLGFMVIIALSAVFGKLLALEGVTNSIANFVMGITDNKYVILLIINIVLLFVGMVMDAGPAIVILAPILVGIVQPLGVNLVHFGVIMVINLSIGLVTPPVGINLFVGLRISKLRIGDVLKPIIYLLSGMIAVLLLVTYVPQLALFLPNLMKG